MDPNPQPTPAADPTVRTDPVVEFIRTDRQMAGYILFGLSIAFLSATIFLAYRGFKAPAAEPEKAAEKAPDPFHPEPPKPEILDPNKTAYTFGWIGTLAGFLITAGVGAWLVAGLPAPTAEQQRTHARVALLAVGSALGVLLICAGVVYFYLWSESLTAWLDRNERKEAVWVVAPLLAVIAGAGLIFAAIQPARAEERNNTLLRRLVYGGNFALTVLLLFVALVVANVAFALRVPNRLDTTSTGFYTLDASTRELLTQLDQPITARAILPDSSERLIDDIRRLLESCQEVSGGKFRVRFINPTLNKTDLASLRANYTQLELNDLGVLLTVGDEDKPATRYAFIKADDFLERDTSMGRGAQPSFAGEAKLMREVRFLAENKERPVVYFTQSNGELDVSGGAEPGRSAAQLKAFLEKNYVDVRPLKFDLSDPKVPADADIVVVAGPRTTFSPPNAEAIKKFMTEPRGEKKGKLVVLSGAPSDPTAGKKVPPTGLEGVLSEFNIGLGNSYIFTRVQGQFIIDAAPTTFSTEAVRGRNQIATTLRRFQVTTIFPREVTTVTPGNPAFRAMPLLETDTDFAWLEEEFPENFNQVIRDLRRDAARKKLSERKTVGVVSGEPGGQRGEMRGRVAVYGSSDIVSDAWAQRTQGTAPVEFDLVGVTIDWQRERPPVPNIASKTYTSYTFPPKVDSTRVLWLPLGLAVLIVAGLGTGVWVIRRK